MLGTRSHSSKGLTYERKKVGDQTQEVKALFTIPVFSYIYGLNNGLQCSKHSRNSPLKDTSSEVFHLCEAPNKKTQKHENNQKHFKAREILN